LADQPTGVLLVNLGTPDAPHTKEVRRYLAEFLSDPRVLDIPWLGRMALLHGVILRTRPAQTAAAYQKVWTDAGSPLLVHSEAFAQAVGEALGPDYRVALGMRYGNPSIASALDRLLAEPLSRLLVLPLFPQWSSAATESALVKLRAEIAKRRDAPPLVELGDFYDDPGFVGAFAEVTRPVLAEFQPDHVLFSYHGLPERQVRRSAPAHCFTFERCCDSVDVANRRCYRAQCFATSRALIEALSLAPDATSTSFQSRLGRTPWIQPYTDVVLPELAQQGVKRLAVLCPAFVADCLETLEEIEIRAAEQWGEAGGEALRLVPSLNAHPAWVSVVVDWMREANA
jgi:ferrochelatase